MQRDNIRLSTQLQDVQLDNETKDTALAGDYFSFISPNIRALKGVEKERRGTFRM